MDQILRDMRKTMLCVSNKGKDGNLQSCFSSLEILWALYDNFLPPSKGCITDANRNRFVLSKGQSTLALMVVLAKKGVIDRTELDAFCGFDSRISMQADRTKFGLFVETSAGSLGHGFPMATGIAWAKKIKGNKGRVYCLAGDGEMNEGTMWEAALFASSEGLSNLTLIIDYNHSIDRMINMGDLAGKLTAFGFDSIRAEGHNIPDLIKSLETETDRPIAVIADTKRGWGSKTLMENKSWFHRFPNDWELESLYKEVDEF